MDIKAVWDTEAPPKIQHYNKPPMSVHQQPQYAPQPVTYYQPFPQPSERDMLRLPEREEDTKAQQAELLAKLNEMFGSTQEVLVAKMNESHRVMLKQTEHVIKENTATQCVDWFGIACLCLLLALFVSYVVMEQCNFKKLMSAINRTQLKSVDLKVMYPNLYS